MLTRHAAWLRKWRPVTAGSENPPKKLLLFSPGTLLNSSPASKCIPLPRHSALLVSFFFSPLHLLLPYSNNRFLFLHLPTCLPASTTTFISMLSLSSISLFEFGDLYFSGFPMSHPFITAIFICLSFNTAAVIGIRSVLPAACAAWNIKKTAAVCSWYCVIISRGSALAHRMVTDGALILLACAGLDEQLLALNASDDLQPQESVNTNLYLCISVLLSDNPTCKFSSVQWTSKISPKKIKKVN